MFSLAMRSMPVLGPLFGLLLAVLTVAMLGLDVRVWFALVVAMVVAGTQFGICPWIMQCIHKTDWRSVASVQTDVRSPLRRTTKAGPINHER